MFWAYFLGLLGKFRRKPEETAGFLFVRLAGLEVVWLHSLERRWDGSWIYVFWGGCDACAAVEGGGAGLFAKLVNLGFRTFFCGLRCCVVV